MSDETFIQHSTTFVGGHRYEVEATYRRADRRLQDLVVQPSSPVSALQLEEVRDQLWSALRVAAAEAAPIPQWSDKEAPIVNAILKVLHRGGWYTVGEIVRQSEQNSMAVTALLPKMVERSLLHEHNGTYRMQG